MANATAWATRTSPPMHGDTAPPAALVTVLVPAYNETATIDTLLRRVLASPLALQVIVIDDGSTDGTAEIVESWQSHPRVEVIHHGKNLGKGCAIRTGLARARGRFVVVQDGDLEYFPEDYPALLRPLLADEAVAVYGSRYLPTGGNQTRWSASRLGVKLLNYAVRVLYDVRLTDEATCYKALRTEVLRALDLQCERFEFCVEVTAKLARSGWRIVEVPIRYQGRSRREGKKIRWRDGWEALQTAWRWRRWRPALSPDAVLRAVAEDCPTKCNNELAEDTISEAMRHDATLPAEVRLPLEPASPKPANAGARRNASPRAETCEPTARTAPAIDCEAPLDPWPWVELGCWTALLLAPMLYWLYGPAVSIDQLIVRTATFGLALTGSVVLRAARIVKKRRRPSGAQSDAPRATGAECAGRGSGAA